MFDVKWAAHDWGPSHRVFLELVVLLVVVCVSASDSGCYGLGAGRQGNGNWQQLSFVHASELRGQGDVVPTCYIDCCPRRSTTEGSTRHGSKSRYHAKKEPVSVRPPTRTPCRSTRGGGARWFVRWSVGGPAADRSDNLRFLRRRNRSALGAGRRPPIDNFWACGRIRG
jgi:hypothetical protein